MLYWPRRHFTGPKGLVLFDTLIRYEIAFKLLVVSLAGSGRLVQYISCCLIRVIKSSQALGLTHSPEPPAAVKI